jgi:hypothetical protein
MINIRSEIIRWSRSRLRPVVAGEIGLDSRQLLCEFAWWFHSRHRAHADASWTDFLTDTLRAWGIRPQQLRKPFHSYTTWNVNLKPGFIIPARTLVTETQLQIAFENYPSFPWQSQHFTSRHSAVSYALFRYGLIYEVKSRAEAAKHRFHHLTQWTPHAPTSREGSGTLFVHSQQLPAHFLKPQ